MFISSDYSIHGMHLGIVAARAAPVVYGAAHAALGSVGGTGVGSRSCRVGAVERESGAAGSRQQACTQQHKKSGTPSQQGPEVPPYGYVGFGSKTTFYPPRLHSLTFKEPNPALQGAVFILSIPEDLATNILFFSDFCPTGGKNQSIFAIFAAKCSFRKAACLLLACAIFMYVMSPVSLPESS